MKKFFVALLFAVVCFGANAQIFEYDHTSGKMYMTYIIENTNMTVEDAYIATEEIFSAMYNNTNATRRETSSKDRLIYKGSFGTLASFNMGAWVIRDNHQIVVSLKNNRIKIDIYSTDVDLDMVNGNIFGEGIRYWSDLYPNDPNMKIGKTNISKASSEEAYNKQRNIYQ